MSLQLYNSLTRKLEEFVPINPGKVGIYSCGPTVYNYVHIGNFRAFVFFDVLKRALRYRGFQVNHVMNITDVDDKTIRGSQKEGKSLKEFTDFYLAAFLEEMKIMKIEMPSLMPRATEYIEGMVQMIQALLEKGYAYKTDKGDVYYKIGSFKDYGKLAQLDLSSLKKNAAKRLSSADEYDKESANDFALWKAHDSEDGDVYWDTSLGRGRPGWHIECSVMSAHHLGQPFDIHTGGIDLLFPHHTNEIAQSEAANGKRFVNYWLHNAHLVVDGRKMSKSLGNYYTLRDLLNKGYDPLVLRYELLKTHYRLPLNFRLDELDQNKNTLRKFSDFIDYLDSVERSSEGVSNISDTIAKAELHFAAGLDDDLNIPQCLAALFEFMNEVNRVREELSKNDAARVKLAMLRFDSVFDIMESRKEELSAEASKLLQERELARKNKNWARSDELRKELLALGIIIEDSPQGQRWKRA